MKYWQSYTPIFVILCLLSSCKSEKILIHINDVSLRVEVADSPKEREKGLSGRERIDGGMLFIFEQEGIYPFWMRNTSVPLSIAFIDKNGVIISIQDMAPEYKNRLHLSPVPILYALEVKMGWFKDNGISVRDTLRFP